MCAVCNCIKYWHNKLWENRKCVCMCTLLHRIELFATVLPVQLDVRFRFWLASQMGQNAGNNSQFVSGLCNNNDYYMHIQYSCCVSVYLLLCTHLFVCNSKFVYINFGNAFSCCQTVIFMEFLARLYYNSHFIH